MTATVSRGVIPYGRQFITDEDRQAVLACLDGDFLTQGPTVDRFETEFARYVGARHAIAVANGTAALHLMYLAHGIGSGDAVIVPAITFAATANAALYCGGTPVFADVDEHGMMTAETAAQAVRVAVEAGLKPKLVVPVHYGGWVADLDGIAAVAAECGANVMDDACHAIGAMYRGRNAGALAPIGQDTLASAWSFHPVKHLTTGEGGCVTTNDSALASRLRRLRSHGITKSPDEMVESAAGKPWYHEMLELGFNYRLPDINAALGLTQLAKVPWFVERRREIAARYRELLAGTPHLQLPPDDTADRLHSYHLFAVQIDFDAAGFTRGELMERLRARGVGSQVHYVTVHSHPFYRRNPHLWKSAGSSRAERFYARELSIPMFPGMSDDDVEHVARVLREELGAV